MTSECGLGEDALSTARTILGEWRDVAYNHQPAQFSDQGLNMFANHLGVDVEDLGNPVRIYRNQGVSL